MRHDLVVTNAFGSYSVGDRITELAEKKAAQENNPSSVVQVAPLPKEADPEDEAKEAEAPAAAPAPRGRSPL